MTVSSRIVEGDALARLRERPPASVQMARRRIHDDSPLLNGAAEAIA